MERGGVSVLPLGPRFGFAQGLVRCLEREEFGVLDLVAFVVWRSGVFQALYGLPYATLVPECSKVPCRYARGHEVVLATGQYVI